MINIKDFDPSLIKIDKKSYKNIDIYYIGYITISSISDYENINLVNPLYLIVGEVDMDTLKKVMEIKQMHQKSVIFGVTGISEIKTLIMNHMFAMVVMI